MDPKSNDPNSKDSVTHRDDNLEDQDDELSSFSKKEKPKTPLSVILAGIVLTILTIVCLKVDNWGRDWTNNTAETNPDAKDVNFRPIQSNLPPAEFSKLVMETMKKASSWKVIEFSDESAERSIIHLVHQTFIMRFSDDVVVEVVKTDGGSTLYAKSKSRFGKGDLGQNPRNIRELISKVRKALDAK